MMHEKKYAKTALRGRVSSGTTITSVPKGDTPTWHVDDSL